MIPEPIYEIDGSRFSTLQDFYEEISRVLIPGAELGHHLGAFNDILRGGFGTPDGGFVLRWKNAAISRERLGYPETVRQRELCLQRCHPTSREDIARRLSDARNAKGARVFDWLIEIVQNHGVGGPEEQDRVEWVLV